MLSDCLYVVPPRLHVVFAKYCSLNGNQRYGVHIKQCLAVKGGGFLCKVTLFHMKSAFCPAHILFIYIHAILEVSTRRSTLSKVEIATLGEISLQDGASEAIW